MTQVLNNLVSNALRHTPHGTIALSAATEGNTVQLRVSDSGSGIDPEDLPFVFDRLYRVDKARQRTDDTSSGLGLAIAKAIVEAHGGTIAVESILGQGATFTITLPKAGDGVKDGTDGSAAHKRPTLSARVSEFRASAAHLRGVH